MNAIRVPTAVFKNNPTPYVEQAKAGQTVIVTRHGRDDFLVLPMPAGRPTPLPIGCREHAPDADEPAFESLGIADAHLACWRPWQLPRG